MVATDPTIVERLAVEAIRLEADFLEVAYKDGCEEVFATGWAERRPRQDSEHQSGSGYAP